MQEKDDATRPLFTHRDYKLLATMPFDQLGDQCRVEVFHASGPGGQGVNTADSAVRMTHEPTGITVTARESRSQFRNRQLCLQKLRQEFERRSVPPKTRHATKPTRGSHERRMQAKHIRSQVKEARRRPSSDD